VVVDVEAEGTGEVVFDKFAETGFAAYDALRCANDIVSVRKEASEVGRGVRDHIENMPDLIGSGKGCPL
jgi:hypothetical protein